MMKMLQNFIIYRQMIAVLGINSGNWKKNRINYSS